MKIYLTPQSYLKLKYYTEEANDEVSGLGSVLLSGASIIIKDVYLFKQNCSTASTDLDKKEVALFIEKFQKEGGDPSKLKLWWHSHDIGGVFFSPTDHQTIEDLGKFSPLRVSIVTNKENELLARVDIFKPFRLTFNECKISILIPEDPALRKQIKREVKKKVSHSLPWEKKQNINDTIDDIYPDKDGIGKALKKYHAEKYKRPNLPSSTGPPVA